jgi:primase-polymerase (primpol)-like protein
MMAASLNFDRVPQSLRSRDQWVLWNLAERDGKPTKIPVQADGAAAKSNDPKTWATFATVREAFGRGGFTGIGFMFSAADAFCGIDLDGCRDPQTGRFRNGRGKSSSSLPVTLKSHRRKPASRFSAVRNRHSAAAKNSRSTRLTFVTSRRPSRYTTSFATLL